MAGTAVKSVGMDQRLADRLVSLESGKRAGQVQRRNVRVQSVPIDLDSEWGCTGYLDLPFGFENCTRTGFEGHRACWRAEKADSRHRARQSSRSRRYQPVLDGLQWPRPVEKATGFPCRR